MLNQVNIIGRVGVDIELHETKSGGHVANVSVACSEKRKNQAGEYVEHTEWIRCVLFNKTAELASKYLSKGKLVYFGGKMQTSSYEKDGNKFYKTEVLVNEMKFLSSAGDTTTQNTQAGFASKSQDDYLDKATKMASGGSAFDSIPF